MLNIHEGTKENECHCYSYTYYTVLHTYMHTFVNSCSCFGIYLVLFYINRLLNIKNIYTQTLKRNKGNTKVWHTTWKFTFALVYCGIGSMQHLGEYIQEKRKQIQNYTHISNYNVENK